MCIAYPWRFPCHCLHYTKPPSLCTSFRQDLADHELDYRFDATLCPLLKPHDRAFCHVTLSDDTSLTIISRAQDPSRRPYRMICAAFERKEVVWSKQECPLHGIEKKVQDLGEVIEIPWRDGDVVGHQVTQDGMAYMTWEWEGVPRRKWVRGEDVDGYVLLRQNVDKYHGKKKGKGDNQPWPKRGDPSWPVRLGMLRGNLAQRQLIP